jgi:hypothetical protein
VVPVIIAVFDSSTSCFLSLTKFDLKSGRNPRKICHIGPKQILLDIILFILFSVNLFVPSLPNIFVKFPHLSYSIIIIFNYCHSNM